MRERAKESTRFLSRGPQQPKATERSSDSTRRVSFNGIPLRLRNNAKQDVLVEFSDVAAHTAKCDTCNNRNRDGMTRCTSCGWQCCRKCLGERGGNRSHQSFTSTHVPSDERRSLPSTPVTDTPTPAPRLASSGRAMVGSRSMPGLTPGSVPAPAHGGRGMVSTAEDREAANALVDISFESSTRNDRGEGRSDNARAGSNPSAASDATAEEDQSRAGHSVGQSRLRGEWTVDEQMEGEEFGNPRRNPSRRARPIDLAE
ncbi:hypothetical protein N7520_006482 [Penicillium odoratum]|uniref:uncharacterized protein n=1 Tax=Penicillium odoratum TaxID=1167516 RepID=UPI002546CA84|nr:uncharacterized protein N7520_006482 [Penicillium odoratum]KAJ5759326.1 hypothetical protein N7520_006482 [Penicillium odoratum]